MFLVVVAALGSQACCFRYWFCWLVVVVRLLIVVVGVVVVALCQVASSLHSVLSRGGELGWRVRVASCLAYLFLENLETEHEGIAV